MDSIKLSVTVGSALRAKYPAAGTKRITAAIAAWIKADRARGITTIHLELDDTAAMKAQGVAALTGKATATKVKRAIDALAKKLAPDYIVILGGDDVVPYFHVANPSYDPNGDTDRTVPTDNPYACSAPYVAKTLKSYLVPDRVVGRIPDLPAAKGGGDAAGLAGLLATAAAWKPKPRSFYAKAYATCCDEWKKAGAATLQNLGLPTADLMISPPAADATTQARQRLGRTLHMTKCHGAEFDAHFYGQKGGNYPEILSAATLAGRFPAGTLAAAMCCYGAQVYSPGDPRANPAGTLPISMTYLAGGAPAFMGSTKIAWVGPEAMMCADWIVAGYLKKVLDGASVGRAMLESRQDYLQYLVNQGQRPDTADEKTLIEFVLLGDPSVHPVAGAATPAPKKAVSAAWAARRDRRIARAVLASGLKPLLHERRPFDSPAAAAARRVFRSVAGLLGAGDAKLLDPATARLTRLLPPAGTVRAALRRGLAVAAREPKGGDALEYAWAGGSTTKDGRRHVRLLTVQTDLDGNVLRTRLLHSA